MGFRAWYAGDGKHPSDSPHARPTDDAHQHRFRLVIGCVSGGDSVRQLLARGEGKKLVAHRARGQLNALAGVASHRPHVPLARHALNFEFGTDLSHALHVRGRPIAQLMVEVASDDIELKALSQVSQQQQASNRVRPARQRHQHAFGAAQHPFALGESRYAQRRNFRDGHRSYLGNRRCHHSPVGWLLSFGAGLITTNGISPSRT